MLWLALALSFVTARYSGDEVRMDSPVEISWESLARTHFKDFPLSNPDRAAIRRNWNEIGRDAPFEFSAPVPPELLRKSAVGFGVGPSGRIRLTRLIGVVRFNSDRDARDVSPPIFFGYVAGRFEIPGLQPQQVAFVAFDDAQNLRVTASVSTSLRPSQADGQTVWSLRNGVRNIAVASRSVNLPPVEIAHSLRFSNTDARYLLVRWKADTACAEACCKNAFDLYIVHADKVEPVLSHHFDCDV